jgi:YVTN family beta-propeller protein
MDKGALMQLNDSKNNIAPRVRGFAVLCAALALGLTFGSRPAAAASFAYVTNVGSNNVSVIDTASNTVVATVPVGFNPVGQTSPRMEHTSM